MRWSRDEVEMKTSEARRDSRDWPHFICSVKNRHLLYSTVVYCVAGCCTRSDRTRRNLVQTPPSTLSGFSRLTHLHHRSGILSIPPPPPFFRLETVMIPSRNPTEKREHTDLCDCEGYSDFSLPTPAFVWAWEVAVRDRMTDKKADGISCK